MEEKVPHKSRAKAVQQLAFTKLPNEPQVLPEHIRQIAQRDSTINERINGATFSKL
jgi:hypothetical protein